MSTVLYCPQCHRKKSWEKDTVNERVYCQCGKDYWAFSYAGINITSPWEHPVNALLLGTIVRTEHPEGTKSIPTILREVDSSLLMEIGMRKYQQESFGKVLMHHVHNERVMDMIFEGDDVCIRGKKDYVSIMRIDTSHSGKITPIEVDYSRLGEPELLRLAEEQTDFRHEEPPLREWQIQKTEENNARTGILFGDAG